MSKGSTNKDKNKAMHPANYDSNKHYYENSQGNDLA